MEENIKSRKIFAGRNSMAPMCGG